MYVGPDSENVYLYRQNPAYKTKTTGIVSYLLHGSAADGGLPGPGPGPTRLINSNSSVVTVLFVSYASGLMSLVLVVA